MKLALHGGKPQRDTLLAWCNYFIDDADIKAVSDAMRSDNLASNYYLRQFEDKMCGYVGVEHCLAVANGTAALHCACNALNLKEGDEVITTPFTFPATVNSIVYEKATPVFADISPDTLDLDPLCAEKLITDKTKAIITVDYSGKAGGLDELKSLAEKHNLILIEDATHSLGGDYKNRKIGSQADMSVFSFFSGKPIMTGEGGMVATNREQYVRSIIEFRNHGITRSKSKLTVKDYPWWYYEQQSLGYNYKMSAVLCALGCSQIDKIDMLTSKRRKIAAYYDNRLSDIEGLIPRVQYDGQSANFLYYILLDLDKLNADRNTVFNALTAENIDVQVRYTPMYRHPYHAKYVNSYDRYPVAEDIYKRIINIPIFSEMTEKDADDVVEAIKKVVGYFLK